MSTRSNVQPVDAFCPLAWASDPYNGVEKLRLWREFADEVSWRFDETTYEDYCGSGADPADREWVQQEWMSYLIECHRNGVI